MIISKSSSQAKAVPTNFPRKDNSVLNFIGDSNPITSNDGGCNCGDSRKRSGETTITVKATIEGKLEQDEIGIVVIE